MLRRLAILSWTLAPILYSQGVVPSHPVSDRIFQQPPQFGPPPQGVITTIAGGDIGPPVGSVSAQSIYLPFGKAVAADGKGNVYVGDGEARVIYRIGADGTASVVAGTGICASSGDGGQGQFASLCNPGGLALDIDGSLYFTDEAFGVVRRISASGVITTVAGAGGGVSLDNVPALSEPFADPTGIAIGPGGRIYVSDVNRVIVIQDGIARFFAGTGDYQGYIGDGGPALNASLDPAGLAVDLAGNVLIADRQNNAIRKVDSSGVISSIAGGPLGPGQTFMPGDANQIYNPSSMAVDPHGRICFTETYSWVRCVGTDGVLGFLVDSTGTAGFSGDGGPAAEARLNFPKGIAFDSQGNLYIADTSNNAVRQVSSSGLISTVANTPLPAADPLPALSAEVSLPTFLTVDGSGNVYFSDSHFDIVRHLSPDDMLETFLYTTIKSSPAAFQGIAVDSRGAVYISSFYRNVVYRVFDDAVSIFAGSGSYASTGDHGPAVNAAIQNPTDLVFDAQGNLYIAEQSRIRKVAPDGTITTFAGNGKRDGKGDGGNAIDASVSPQFLAWHDGNLYFAEGGAYEIEAPQPQGDRIREVTPDGLIQTIAGNGEVRVGNASLLDGGLATASGLGNITGLAVDPSGRVHFSERLARVRRIEIDGTLATVAGTLSLGFSGDGGLAVEASVFDPRGIAFDTHGNLYIADANNHRIREVLVAPPTFTVDQKTLSFSANAGGAAAASQSVSVTASIPGVYFFISTSSSWLQASISQANLSDGATPCQVSISADPALLSPGRYSGTVTFASSVGQPVAVSVAVNFVVGTGQPARLLVDQSAVTFTLPRSGGQQVQDVVLSNAGTGSYSFAATAGTRTGGNWLSLSPSTGRVTPQQPVLLSLAADVHGLAPGTYSGQVAIDAGPAGSAIVQVILTVSFLDQTLQLTQSGLSFIAVSGGGLAPSQSFGIKNLGTGSLPWTSSSMTTDGAGWLSISEASGSSVAGEASPRASVSVDHRGLVPKHYYGLAQVTAPGAANSPQAVTIHLDVLPPGSDPGAVIQPAELVFSAPPGATPGAQEVFVYNLTSTPLSFRAGSNLAVGKIASFSLSFLPYDGVVLPGVPFRLLVQPSSAPVADSAGVLSLQFSNGKVSSVPLRVSIAATNAPAGRATSRAITGCSPTKLIAALTVIGQSSSYIPAAWPTGLSVDVQDDCRRPITSGTVVVKFSNGDPPLSLSSNGDGTWQGTWMVGFPAPNITLTVSAADSQTSLTGATSGIAGLQGTYDPPVVTKQSVVSGANPVANQPVAPGGIISIFGQRLSSSTSPLTTDATPLPAILGDTSVFIGSRRLPLFYASDTQLKGIVPWDLPTDTQQQLIISRGSTLSDPIGVNVAQAQPAMFLNPQPDAPQQGLFTILRSDGSSQTSFLNSSSAPARAGDTLVVYSLGLGTVTNQPDTGLASPTSPLAQTTTVPVLMVGDRALDVSFAGLTPGSVGLYQVQATLPNGISTGVNVPVTIEVKGQISSPVTLAIQ